MQVKLCALHANRGTVLEALDRPQEAYQEFQKSLSVNPQDNTGPGPAGNCYYKSGVILMQNGHPE